MDADRVPEAKELTPSRARRVLSVAVNHIGFVCIALVLVYCVVHAFDPPRLNWGDSGSDYNVMTSGRNFQKYGFLHLHLTPFLLDPAYMTQYDRMFIYTHYPQLPDLMNGVLRTVFGMSELVQFRFVALGFSFAALYFIYTLITWFWSRRIAQIAIALWVVNPLWIQHADYLHHAPYGAFFGFGTLYFLTRYLREEQRPRMLVGAGAFLFFAVLASYDWWFFGPLLIAGITFAHYRGVFRPPAWRILGTLACCAIAAVLFKVATNAWALGGIQGMLADLRFQYAERATDKITRTSYQNGVLPTMYGRVERFFTVLFFAMALFWALFPVLRKRWGGAIPVLRRPVLNPGVLMLAALPFLILFTEIWVAQYYPGLLVLPFYAVGSAAIVAMLLDAGTRGADSVAAALVIALLANSVDENLSFKPAYFDPAAIQTLKVRLDSLSPPGKQVLVNHVFDAPYRYYFNRNMVAMALIPPGVSNIALASFADEATHPRTGTANGTIFVQHKHLTDEMYDKGYYYILGRYKLWGLWGNPRKNRKLIDEIMRDRDSTLMANVAKVGEKLYDNDFYTLWRIKPQPMP